jgi:hypothetical protein
MPIKKRFMTGLRNQMFKKGGRGYNLMTGKIESQGNVLMKRKAAKVQKI